METLNFTPLAVPTIHKLDIVDFPELQPQVIYASQDEALASAEYAERVQSHFDRTGNWEHHTIVCECASGGWIVSYL
jgi:hypothetical protein